MAVAVTKGVLEDGEQAPGPGKANRHGAEFAQELVPAGARHAAAGRAHLVQEFIESLLAVLRKFDCFGDGVDVPAQHAFAMGPVRIALTELFG